MKNCINYNFELMDLLIPSKTSIKKICNLNDKRNLFMISVIRFIIYIYLILIYKKIYKKYNTNFVFNSLFILFYSIITTITIINLLIIYYIKQKTI
jgi:hypothetical protein